MKNFQTHEKRCQYKTFWKIPHQFNFNLILTLTTNLKFQKEVPIVVYEEFTDDKIEN
jgi:hypothetical protein